jgi:hypothetical protein
MSNITHFRGAACLDAGPSTRSETPVDCGKLGGMTKPGKTLTTVIRGNSDANIGFDDLTVLLRVLGFSERIRGSHHIFTKDGVEEILNIQPKGRTAKPYQVKQVRAVLLRYKLAGDNDEQ